MSLFLCMVLIQPSFGSPSLDTSDIRYFGLGIFGLINGLTPHCGSEHDRIPRMGRTGESVKSTCRFIVCSAHSSEFSE